MAAPGMAGAQTPPKLNLYDGYTSLPSISFAGGKMTADRAPSVFITMNGNATAVQTTMDTGSTGIMVGTNMFTPSQARGDVNMGQGMEVLSSDGNYYTGALWQTNVAINSTATVATHDRAATAGGVVATSRVTVLLVTGKTCTTTARDCTPVVDPNMIYMGVGFDRGSSALSAAGVATNPFTNITAVGPAAGNIPLSALRQGYRITNTGVTLGLDSSNTRDYALIKLTQNPAGDGQASSREWLTAPVTIKVAGTTGNGTILPDTGISTAFLTPAAGAVIPEHDCPPHPGGKHCITKESDTKIELLMPGQTGTSASYHYRTGETDNPMQPVETQVVRDGPTIFFNSGRNFYEGFDYVYDAAGGYVGYKWKDTDYTHGGTTPSLALIGNVGLQNGFSDGLPTFLMGATTLLQTGTGEIWGDIWGSGGLTIGSGQVNLTGINSYTGGTSVTAGAILGINHDRALGDASGGLTLAGGTLQALDHITTARAVTLGAGGGTFDTNGFNVALGTAVTGVGGLTKNGLGILTLAGANSYTGGTVVNQGILRLDAGASLSPIGALVVNAGGTFDANGNDIKVGSLSGTGGTISLGSGNLIADQAGNTTLAAVITGTGGVSMTGPGTLNLTGVNTYTGPTSITNGRLAVNGSITSNVTVGSGGNLGGAGTIFGTVTSAGTLAPGNSIGTLTVNGSLTQNPGSTYQVEANAGGQADRINVTGAPGTATINGGSVSVLAAFGTYAPSTTYTILNATGGVSGTYAGSATNFPFLQSSLSYDSNNVYLTLAPGGFARGAASANQAAVGGVLDRSVAGATGDLATVVGTLSTVTLAQGQAVMDAISGQNYSGFSTANLGSGLAFMNMLGQQMSLARGGSGAGSRMALAQACDVACDGDGASRFSVWGSALGGGGSIAGNGNSSTLSYNTGGTAAGIDYRVDPRILVGVGVGFASGNQYLGGFSGRGSSDSYQASLYASFTQSAFYLDALAGYGFNDNTMTRQIFIPGLAPRTATGRSGANQIVGQAEAGYKVDIYAPAMASLTPFARLQGISNNQAAFSESGASSLSLSVAQQTTNALRSTFGAELSGALDVGWRDKLALQFRLGWTHEYADVARPVTASFAGAPGAAFTVFGAAPLRDSATIGLAANTAIAASTSLYLRYDGEFGTGSDSHAISAGLRMSW